MTVAGSDTSACSSVGGLTGDERPSRILRKAQSENQTETETRAETEAKNISLSLRQVAKKTRQYAGWFSIRMRVGVGKKWTQISQVGNMGQMMKCVQETGWVGVGIPMGGVNGDLLADAQRLTVDSEDGNEDETKSKPERLTKKVADETQDKSMGKVVECTQTEGGGHESDADVDEADQDILGEVGERQSRREGGRGWRRTL
ncbi:hypothetical protein PG994_007519 [Apiospora phragmitis]|uniref:Uncharacterized protein n=1 Tax=Apiospora phragmitis TaxID=2905665 RepID=A0ABR1V3I4_9PEZI